MVRPTKKPSLTERVRAVWRVGIGYHDLMREVFPESEYPNAFRFSTNGGPPGCAMAFGMALRRLGIRRGRNGNTLEGSPTHK